MVTLLEAVVTQLRQQGLAGGRVFQAFQAPSTTPAPYAAVKLAGVIGSAQVRQAGHQMVELYLYAPQTTAQGLEDMTQAAIAALHHQPLAGAYRLAWASTAGDAVDEPRRLLTRLVRFTAAYLVSP